MKFVFLTLVGLGLGLFAANLTGCQTSSPGTTDTLGSFTSTVDGASDKVTTAAQKAAADLKLADIVGNGTKVDGKVTAKTAQGDIVTIDIVQAGDKISKVTIRVGTTGDEAVSKQLVDKIKAHLSSIF